MARHPMSSSWPQLTARSSVSGESSWLASSGEVAVRTAQVTILASPRGHDDGALCLWRGVRLQVLTRGHRAAVHCY